MSTTNTRRGTRPDAWAAGQVAAVDLGGTKTAACLVNRLGEPGPVRTRPTPAQDGPAAVLGQVADLVREVGHGLHLVGVGVGTAGVVDPGTGRILSSTDAIADWAGTDVAAGLTERLGLPVSVDNDVNVHAAGEVWRGAAAGATSALMVAVGTGVGAGVVVNGALLHGAHHVAGEMGHMPARGAAHLRCACGRAGHIEAIASGPGLLQHYHWLGGDDTIQETRHVVAAAEAGDRVAVRAVREAAQALGSCLAGVVTVLDPEVVVIGGGLADAGAGWWDTMEDTFRSEVIDVLTDVPVRRAALGGMAPLVGAARQALSAAWDETKEQA